MTPEEARDAFDAMNDDDKNRVRSAVKGGALDRVKAVQSVLEQNTAFENEQPTTKERVGAGALGAANALGGNLADEVVGAVNFIAPKMGEHPVDAYRRGRDEQRRATGDAQEVAPGAYGGGELAGVGIGALAGGGKAAAGSASMLGAARQAAKVGAGVGAVSGFGAGEGAGDTALKTAVGGAAGGALGAVAGGGAAAAKGMPALLSRAPGAAKSALSTLKTRLTPGAKALADAADSNPLVDLAVSPVPGGNALLSAARALIKGGKKAEAPAKLPDFLTSVADDAADTGAGAPSGLDLAPLPPLPKKPPKINITEPVEDVVARPRRPRKPRTKKTEMPPVGEPPPSSAPAQGMPPLPVKPRPAAADMPADVAMGGAAAPKPLPPPASVQFMGQTDALARQVGELPSASRVARIHEIAAQHGKKIAEKVAKQTGVSLKLNPL